jgi:hypothetical protein
LAPVYRAVVVDWPAGNPPYLLLHASLSNMRLERTSCVNPPLDRSFNGADDGHIGFDFYETLFLEASMSGPGPTATPFVGSDRRSEILDRLAARARATPPATTPQAIASRVAASIQNQMKEPPREAHEHEGGEYVKYPDKDRKDLLDGRRPGKDEKDDKDEKDEPDKQASEKGDDKDDKDVQDVKDVKDNKDNKDNKDKEASDKSENKDVIDDKNDKDVKDVKDNKDNKENKDNEKDKEASDKGDDKEGDKDNSDKDDDTGTGTFTDDEFVDPADRGQSAETSASRPPAGGTGRPTSLFTRLPVV